ncbi:MAG TPA: hypothetical protein ENK91_01605 [Bacteroidetes bacterium]|nr:hypothetical protein [Bacteroidota bacterium]
MRTFVFTLFLLVSLTPFIKAGEFDNVDKYARSIHKTSDYKTLTKKLVASFKTDKEKARAIYVWITDNIRYDWNKFIKGNNKRQRIQGRSKKEIQLKKQKLKEKKINKVYSSGKGVCEDYSMLFEAMCRIAGVKSAYIRGYTRTNSNSMRFPTNSKHAWNAIQLGGKWYLIDATWGAGYVTNGRFHKKFEDGFFMTKPEIFILSHFPKEQKWQLLEHPISKQMFPKNPYLHSGFYEFDIVDFTPKYGFLSAKNKFSIVKLKFKNKAPNVYQYKNGKLKPIESTKNGNEIELKIPTLAEYNRNIKLVVKKGKKAIPLITYKIK